MAKLLENEIKNFYITNNLEMPQIYCKDCGKLLIYDNAYIHFNKHHDNLVTKGLSYLTKRIYNNKEYSLCRCKECISQKYPELNKSKYPLAQWAANYCQYAFNVPDDEWKIVTKSRQSVTKEKMIKKYGEEGIKKWDEYCNKQSVTNTYDYKHKKYGMSRDEFLTYNKSRSCTLENFIKRHGEEEGNRLWNEYCERQRYTTSIEYFIDKYGFEIGHIKYANFDHGRTTFGGASIKADNFFSKLSKHEIFNNHELYFNNNPIEYCIKGYRLDFYDKTINLAIEFYGDYWHCNPKNYSENDIIENPFTKEQKIVKEVWKKDKSRQTIIENALKCTFIVVWESDVKNKNKKQETINKIINIIKNKN